MKESICKNYSGKTYYDFEDICDSCTNFLSKYDSEFEYRYTKLTCKNYKKAKSLKEDK